MNSESRACIHEFMGFLKKKEEEEKNEESGQGIIAIPIRIHALMTKV